MVSANAPAWSQDGERLASGGDDARLTIWDSKQADELVSFAHPTPVVALAWSGHNGLIATAGGAAWPVVHIWPQAI